MAPSATPNITQLLVAWNQGDQDALAQLTPLVYRELHRLAHGYLAGERRGHVLQTTALVNEAFVPPDRLAAGRMAEPRPFFWSGGDADAAHPGAIRA